LLQLTSSDLLLVRRVSDCVGSTWPHRLVLRPLHALSATTILFAMAIGCVANWRRNRTLHCAITGPLFFFAAVVFLLSDVFMAHVNSLWVWPFVLIGVGIAFLLEWRYAQHSPSRP
jgi:hypothetical protein